MHTYLRASDALSFGAPLFAPLFGVPPPTLYTCTYMYMHMHTYLHAPDALSWGAPLFDVAPPILYICICVYMHMHAYISTRICRAEIWGVVV